MPLSNTEKASRRERSDTPFATSSSSVNKYPSLLPNTKQRIQKNSPISTEVLIRTLIENFAALASPLPSSFATRTLLRETVTNEFCVFMQQEESSVICMREKYVHCSTHNAEADHEFPTTDIEAESF